MTTDFKHVVVIGPGAIGCCLAVRLALAAGGPKVTLIDHRADRAARLSARPILIHTPSGDLEARIAVRTAPDAPADLVLLATKAYAARAAAAAAAVWIGGAPVVCLQNGLGVAAEVAAALPRTKVVTGVSYQGANFVREGEFNHVAILRTHLGYEGRGPDDTVRAAAGLLGRAGYEPRVEADMTPLVWGKLIVNAAINPVAALVGVTNGEVDARPTLRALAAAIVSEAEAVARARNIALPYADGVEAMLATARGTADNRCSMLQDLEAGRPTEIDYLNGAIAASAEGCGVAAPANRAIAALIRQVSAVRL
ncbi:MAG: 2-dehydropantoate 2-reductase [Planctomycetota bacterium]|nr:2-dehydropantoate 2-reductase [Planctomycetota bacterium]